MPTCSTGISVLNTIITGFQNIGTWIAILAIPSIALVVGLHAWGRSTATDETSMIHHSRALRSSLTYGIVALLGGGLVGALVQAFIGSTCPAAAVALPAAPVAFVGSLAQFLIR